MFAVTSNTSEQRNASEQQQHPSAPAPEDQHVPLVAPEADQAVAEAELRKRLTGSGEQRITATIVIEKIVVDENSTQIRNALTENAVRQYVRNYKYGSGMPPIEVAVVDDIFYLVDGYHRLEALRRLGRTTVTATVYELPDLESVVWRGWEINSKPGVHYTNDERRKAFKLYIKLGRCYVEGKPRIPRWLKSMNQIGRDWSIHPNTAKALIKELHRPTWEMYLARGEGRMENAGGSLQAGSYRKMRHVDTAERNLANVLNIAKKLNDPVVRGALIAKTEAVANEMKTDSPWTPFVEEEEDF